MLEHLSDKDLIEYYKIIKSAPKNMSDRKEMVKEKGSDVKNLYHIVRLFDEAEQILLTGELDLQRAREAMKSVRRGDWTAQEIQEWAMKKEIALEAAYTNCKLPDKPPIEPLRQLLLNCLEHHYGSLDNCVAQVGWAEQSLREIDTILDKARKNLYK